MQLFYNFIRNADGTKVTVLTYGVSRFFVNVKDIEVLSSGNFILIKKGSETIFTLEHQTMAINGVPFVGDIAQAKEALSEVFRCAIGGGGVSNGTAAHFVALDFTGSKIVLPHVPKADSLHVIVGGITLTVGADFVVNGNEIPLSENRTEPVNVNVFYEY
ncbi:MAG: DUF4815 domain-containing protein [Sphingobacteriaceae bacterium]|nr:DUF4815 domain-containing protein [Sphingobacteriaceae bacterium]